MFNLNENHTVLRPDAKGRVTLGKYAKGISSFSVTMDEQGRIIMEPYVEIPQREQWLYHNKEALEHVQQGLRDSATGRVSWRGDFSRYLDDEME